MLRLSETTQVILLTHHRHLLDVLRDASAAPSLHLQHLATGRKPEIAACRWKHAKMSRRPPLLPGGLPPRRQYGPGPTTVSRGCRRQEPIGSWNRKPAARARTRAHARLLLRPPLRRVRPPAASHDPRRTPLAKPLFPQGSLPEVLNWLRREHGTRPDGCPPCDPPATPLRPAGASTASILQQGLSVAIRVPPERTNACRCRRPREPDRFPATPAPRSRSPPDASAAAMSLRASAIIRASVVDMAFSSIPDSTSRANRHPLSRDATTTSSGLSPIRSCLLTPLPIRP